MSVETFEAWSLYILVSGLMLFMGYIVWDLAKKSEAGKFGTFVMFFVLGLGVLGFVIKTVIAESMNV